MDLQKVVKVTRKLALIVAKEFPDIGEDDAREELVKTLIALHMEFSIMPALFKDKWDDDLA